MDCNHNPTYVREMPGQYSYEIKCTNCGLGGIAYRESPGFEDTYHWDEPKENYMCVHCNLHIQFIPNPKHVPVERSWYHTTGAGIYRLCKDNRHIASPKL